MAAPDKRDGAVIPFARPRAISSLGPPTFGIPSIAKPTAPSIDEEAPPTKRSRRSTPPNEMKVTPLFGYQAQGAPVAPTWGSKPKPQAAGASHVRQRRARAAAADHEPQRRCDERDRGRRRDADARADALPPQPRSPRMIAAADGGRRAVAGADADADAASRSRCRPSLRIPRPRRPPRRSSRRGSRRRSCSRRRMTSRGESDAGGRSEPAPRAVGGVREARPGREEHRSEDAGPSTSSPRIACSASRSSRSSWSC